MTAPHTTPTATRVEQLRGQLLDQGWVVIALVSYAGIPVSLLRTMVAGWQPANVLHAILLVVFTFVAWRRHRLSTRVKTFVMVASLTLMGIGGTVSFGLMNVGVWFMALGMVVTGIVLSRGAAMVTLLVSILALVGVMLGFHQGILTLSFDANLYHQQLAPWVMMIVSSMMLPALALWQVKGYEKALIDALKEVETQRNAVAIQANYDHLTGLASRRLAMDRLDMSMRRLRRQGGLSALLFIDLDGFKAVNDRHGHKVGDQMLVVCARRLKEVLRVDDTLCRYGGDEFLVIANNLKHEDNAVAIAKKIIAVLEQPAILAAHTLHLSASVGIAYFTEEADHPEQLIEASDQAMYKAKHAGKGRWVVHGKEAGRSP